MSTAEQLAQALEALDSIDAFASNHWPHPLKELAATLRQHIESTAAELATRHERQHQAEQLAGEYLIQRDDARAELEALRKDAAEAEQCTELAQALEQRRALAIAETVQALEVGGANVDMPTPFQAGYQLACEEIIHRLRTEVWDLLLPPVDAALSTSTAPSGSFAPPPNSGEGGR